MSRRFSILCLIGAGTFTAWGAYSAMRDYGQVPALIADRTTFDLGKMHEGRYPIVVTLSNPSATDLAVTIPAGSCGNRSCLTSDPLDRAFKLCPGQQIEVTLELEVKQLGQFTSSIRLLACGTHTEVVLITVTGECVPNGGAHENSKQ